MDSRTAQRGSIRGCCCGTFLAAIILLGGLLVWNAHTTPPGVTAPIGPSTAPTAAGIIAAVGNSVESQLPNTGHARIVLTERDLTVLAQSVSGATASGTDPTLQVTTWNGKIVIADVIHIGPIGIWRAGYFTLSSGESLPLTTPTLSSIQFGSFSLPSGLVAFLGSTIAKSDPVATLFQSSTALASYSQSFDCATVTSKGIVVWVHGPRVPALPGLCTEHQ